MKTTIEITFALCVQIEAREKRQLDLNNMSYISYIDYFVTRSKQNRLILGNRSDTFGIRGK